MAKSGKGVEKGWPGGRRDGCMLRFAEADTASASEFRLCAFNTALARKGLAVFNRSAHSAGPRVLETRVQAEIEATVNKPPQEQWQNQNRRYENLL